MNSIREGDEESQGFAQVTQNMDDLTVEKYVEWLLDNYVSERVAHPSIDVMPLLHKVLYQQEVYILMRRKIEKIRSNGYLMEEKKTVDLYREISKVIVRIVEADLENVVATYYSFLNILDAKGQLGRTYSINPKKPNTEEKEHDSHQPIANGRRKERKIEKKESRERFQDPPRTYTTRSSRRHTECLPPPTIKAGSTNTP